MAQPTEPAVQHPPARVDDKGGVAHVEMGGEDDDRDYKTGNHVADSDARNYLNPDLVISDEENKRLRRRIHKR
jgi:hypothetical protein